jgi:hypothetical protein
MARYKSLALVGFSSLVLLGCSGVNYHSQIKHDQQDQNLKAWEDASSKFKSCNAPWQKERRAQVPAFNDIVSEPNDPRFFFSQLSKAPVSKEFKGALTKFRPQQLACRNALLDDIGKENFQVKALYIQVFRAYDQGVVEILDGKMKTMGEVNRAYVKYVGDANEARERLRMKMLHYSDQDTR